MKCRKYTSTGCRELMTLRTSHLLFEQSLGREFVPRVAILWVCWHEATASHPFTRSVPRDISRRACFEQFPRLTSRTLVVLTPVKVHGFRGVAVHGSQGGLPDLDDDVAPDAGVVCRTHVRVLSPACSGFGYWDTHVSPLVERSHSTPVRACCGACVSQGSGEVEFVDIATFTRPFDVRSHNFVEVEVGAVDAREPHIRHGRELAQANVVTATHADDLGEFLVRTLEFPVRVGCLAVSLPPLRPLVNWILRGLLGGRLLRGLLGLRSGLRSRLG